MSIVITKGFGYSGQYASTDFPVLDANWAGTVSVYTTYPGTPVLTKALTRSGNVMALTLTIAEVLGLSVGTYSFVSTISNSVLGVSISNLTYAVITDINLSPTTLCKLFGTILKADGTAAGANGSVLVNTPTGAVLTPQWQGVDITASIAVADAISGDIIDTERITTKTDGTGYFELYVMQGLTVDVSCPYFGKTVSIVVGSNTSIDLSASF